jgi:alkylhydroperoxidase family enzyme
MEQRLNMNVVEPEGYKAMLQLEKYLGTTQVSGTHKELIKAGEKEHRIYALTCWRETPFFTEEERAVLALTEEVTLIAQHVSNETYNHAVKLLGEKYVAQLIMVIIVINGWNRIGVTTNMAPAER